MKAEHRKAECPNGGCVYCSRTEFRIERDRYRGLLSEAEGWFEEIQHAGYSVPMGRGEAFVEFWERLQREVG